MQHLVITVAPSPRVPQWFGIAAMLLLIAPAHVFLCTGTVICMWQASTPLNQPFLGLQVDELGTNGYRIPVKVPIQVCRNLCFAAL